MLDGNELKKHKTKQNKQQKIKYHGCRYGKGKGEGMVGVCDPEVCPAAVDQQQIGQSIKSLIGFTDWTH